MTKAKILVVDDEEAIREVVSTLLEAQDYECTAVSNGLLAEQYLSQHTVDLVLSDMVMPEIDGFQATRQIREAEKISGAHVPIVAMTAYAMSGDRERCLEAGMDGYVSKPVSRAALEQALEQHADRAVAGS